MIQQRRPSLRLLSLNVNGLRSASKRRSLFTLLRRDRWDVVLLQETHHTDEAEGQAWAEEGPHGLTANWSGPSFWSHGSAASRGVAVLFRAAAHTADISIRHQSADGRILSMDFSFADGEFTIASIYAPCTAVDRAAFFIQHLLPSPPAQRQLLLGGDFNCIADQLDIVDPAGAAGARMAGYYDGLRIVETEHQLYDVWRDRHPDGRTFTHAGTAGLSAARLDRWLLSQQLRPWVSTAFFCVCVCVEESLHAHRCQSYQQFERQIQQTTEECRVHSTSYDKGSCFAMA